MEKSKKRKRDADHPRIAYHTSARTFDRLFKEDTLGEMKEVARRKLGLDPDTPISFAQIREDNTVDLEDGKSSVLYLRVTPPHLTSDDDFDAFYSLAHSTNFVNVRVTVGGLETGPANSHMTSTKKKKRKCQSGTSPELPLEVDGRQDECDVPANGNGTAIETSRASSDAADTGEPRKKKRKANMGDSIVGDDVSSRAGGNQTDISMQPATFVTPSNTGLAQPVDADVPSTSSRISTSADDQSGPKTKRAKAKTREQAAEPPTVPQLTAESVPPTEKKSKKKSKSKAKDAAGDPMVRFAQQLAGVISETSETNGLAMENPAEPHEEPQETKRKSSKRDSHAHRKSETKQSNALAEVPTAEGGVRPKKIDENQVAVNGGAGNLSTHHTISRQSTTKELRAYEADADAFVSRRLVEARAALAASAIVTPRVQEAGIVSVQKTKKKEKMKVSTAPRHQPPQDDSDLREGLFGRADPSESVSSLLDAQIPQSSHDSGHCPFCLLSPLHGREKCPLLLGGPESLEERLSKLQEAPANVMDNQNAIIAELQQLLATAGKDLERDMESQVNGRLSQRFAQETRCLALNENAPRPRRPPLVPNGKDMMPPLLKTKTTMRTSGTSNTSSDDSSEDESLGETRVVLSVPKVPSQLANVNLDDLIRGPNVPVLRAADITSPASSEEEADQVLEEDEDHVPRRSQRIGIPDSSDDTDSGLDEENSAAGEHIVSSPANDPEPDVLSGSGTDHVSFQAVGQRGESQNIDTSADVALGAALAADTSVFKLANVSQGTASSSQPPRALEPSSTQVTPAPASLETLVDAPPTTTTAVPAEQTAFEPLPSPSSMSLVNLTSESDNREDARHAGIIQRMKTRSAKGLNNDKTSNTPKASQTPRTRSDQPSQEISESAVRRTRATTRRQTLGTMSPPALPAKLGRQSRLIRASDSAQSIEDSNGVTDPSSNSQDAMSLDTWTILKPSSPTPDIESAMMVDELEPSSPPHPTNMDVVNPKVNGASQDGPTKNPLFILTESQPPFPYSQWNDGSQPEVENDAISNDSDDENEVEATVQRSQAKPSQTLKYRRLTDISSDHGLFSTPTNLRPISSAGSEQGMDMYGRLGQEDIESESDSESDDSDVQEQSHIPKSRRAGVIQSKRK